MIKKLNELVLDFPLKPEVSYSNQFLLIKDTFTPDGNFIISQLLNYLLREKEQEKILFIAAHQNYAHYSNVSKKTGCPLDQHILKEKIQFLDLHSRINDWIPEDLPFTEKTHENYAEPPSMVQKITINDNQNKEDFQKIISIVEDGIKDGRKHIVIDNFTDIYNSADNKGVIFQFFSELYKLTQLFGINLYILITYLKDDDLLKHTSIIEQYPTITFEFFENPSGYQQDIAGQLIVKLQNKTSTPSKYIVKLSENIVDIDTNYKI